MLFSKRITSIPLALIFIILCCLSSCYSGPVGQNSSHVTENDLILHWKRPNTVECPHVWHRFPGRDLNNKTIEYRIEDLNPSRIEDVFDHLRKHYVRDEPVMQLLGVADDDVAFEDLKIYWRAIIKQKMALVCYKAGSNEIIGVNMNYVDSIDDDFPELWDKNFVKSPKTRFIISLPMFLDDFDICEDFDVLEYLTSFAISVDKKYRGRGIAEQFLKIRKEIGKQFNIKLTINAFSSRYASQSAEKVGFQTINGFKFADAAKHPDYTILQKISGEEYLLKALILD